MNYLSTSTMDHFISNHEISNGIPISLKKASKKYSLLWHVIKCPFHLAETLMYIKLIEMAFIWWGKIIWMVISLTEKWDMKSRVTMIFDGYLKRVQKPATRIRESHFELRIEFFLHRWCDHNNDLKGYLCQNRDSKTWVSFVH